MEHIKVAGAVGANGILAMAQEIAQSSSLESVLLVCQIGVAVVTIIYIGTKVFKLWKKDK